MLFTTKSTKFFQKGTVPFNILLQFNATKIWTKDLKIICLQDLKIAKIYSFLWYYPHPQIPLCRYYTKLHSKSNHDIIYKYLIHHHQFVDVRFQPNKCKFIHSIFRYLHNQRTPDCIFPETCRLGGCQNLFLECNTSRFKSRCQLAGSQYDADAGWLRLVLLYLSGSSGMHKSDLQLREQFLSDCQFIQVLRRILHFWNRLVRYATIGFLRQSSAIGIC